MKGVWLIWDLCANGFFSRRGPTLGSTSEETAGILSKIFLWWMNPLLKEGYRASLNLAILPAIDGALSSQKLRKQALRAWARRCRSLNASEKELQH
jgi:hypothetical protein